MKKDGTSEISSENLRQLCKMAQRLEEIMAEIWNRSLKTGVRHPDL